MNDIQKNQTVWLVRHGPVDVPDGTLLGWTDLPLSEPDKTADGMRRFAQAMGSIRTVVASDLTRTRQTASFLAEALGAELRLDPAWREVNFGDWEMQNWRALSESKDPIFHDFLKSWLTVPPPGGESYEQMFARIEACWRQLLQTERDGPIVVVSHGGALAAMSSVLLGWSAKDGMKNMISRGNAGRVELPSGDYQWNIDPFTL